MVNYKMRKYIVPGAVLGSIMSGTVLGFYVIKTKLDKMNIKLINIHKELDNQESIYKDIYVKIEK